MTPATRPDRFGFAMYARSDAPSAPFTSGFDTAIRGSSGFTVTPSVVAVAGGVAYGPAATRPAVAVAAAVGVAPPPTLVPGVAVAMPPAPVFGERSHAARMVEASAALPAISETRRTSSRRVM